MKEIIIFSFFLVPCLIGAYKIQEVPINPRQTSYLYGASGTNYFYMNGTMINSSILKFSITSIIGTHLLFYCFTQNDPNLDSTRNRCEFKSLNSFKEEWKDYQTLIYYYEISIDKQFLIVRYSLSGVGTLNIISIKSENSDNNKNPSIYYTFDEVDIIFIALGSIIFLIILIYIIIFLCKSKEKICCVPSKPTHPAMADSTSTSLAGVNNNNYPTYYVQ